MFTPRYLLALLVLLSSVRVLGAAYAPPNIVVILVDDMGFSDIGCYGSEIATPNIDRLAREGVRFRQFYNASRCCPTRAALLTGLYPHQAGVGDMVNDLGRPAYQGYLNDRCVTIAEVLRQQGYRTLMSGKWHVGEKQPHWPTDRGFDHAFGLISGATDYFRREQGRTWALDGKPFEATGDEFYLTDAITKYAQQFVGEALQEKKPFFLYLAYNAPHWPLHARPQDIEKYLGKYRAGWDVIREQRFARQRELGVVPATAKLPPRDPEVHPWAEEKQQGEYERRMAVYAAQLDRVDQGIGRVLAQLEQAGADQNTVVIFLSDNGGCHEIIERSSDPAAATGLPGSYRSYGRGWANASNTPFRRFKHWVHEGGIATPLIVRWPGKLKQPGGWSDELGHVVDLMPTCLELAGTIYPSEFQGRKLTPLAGRSLVPVLRHDAPLRRDPLCWEHEGNRAVRRGPWKLVAAAGQKWELYNLAEDRTELNDLSAARPDLVEHMNADWSAWATKVGVVPYDELRRNAGKKAGSRAE